MRKFTKILYFLLIICSLNGYSQNESFWTDCINKDIEKLNFDKYERGDFEKVYRIWKSYQVIELVKQNDSIYSGKLVNFVIKTNRKPERNKIIKEELEIPPITVKKLIDSFSFENIEILPDCDDIEGYPSGFDGTNYIFEIIRINSKRIYSYWEPMNDYIQNDSIKELKNIRTIITNLKTEINPGLHFRNFTDNLDYGSYYYGGTNMTKIKNVW